MNRKMTRRTLIQRGIQIPLGGAMALWLSGCGEGSEETAQSACADPESMSSSEASMRSSLGYTSSSSDPSQTCAACAYFKAGSGGCGGCDLLGGSQVDAGGRCNSWSAAGD